MKKVRVLQKCKVCGVEFEIYPCRVGHIVTCGRDCSLKYRSMNSKGRPITWVDKIIANRPNRPLDRSYITDEYREKKRQAAIKSGFGKANKGRPLAPEHVAKLVAAQTGHTRGGWKFSEKTRTEMSERFKGANSTFWRGGVTSRNAIERSSAKYRAWRTDVFTRDDYTCQICGARGVELNADHIQPFALHPELRYELSNGRTLCVPCHRGTPTYGRRTKNRNETVHGIQISEVR